MDENDIALLNNEIESLLLKEQKEKDQLHIPFLNKRKSLLDSLSSIHESAKQGVLGYNSRSFMMCKIEEVKVNFVPLEIKINPEFENIFQDNIEKIKKGAQQFNVLTNANVSSFLEIKSLIGPAININQYIIDNFDKFYDAKYKKEEDKEYQKQANIIHEKYQKQIDAINNQIAVIQKQLDEQFINAHIQVRQKQDNSNEYKVVVGFKDSGDFIYQDFINQPNMLYHANHYSKYPFLKDLLLQYFDKLGDKNIEIILIGDMPTDVAGLAIALKKASSNPLCISDVHRLNDADYIFNELIEKLENRSSRYLIDGGFFAFNENNPSNKDTYIINIVDDITSLSEDNKTKLTQIIQDGPSNGIFTVLISDDNYKEPSAYSDESCIKFDSSIDNFVEFNCFDEEHPLYNEEEVDLKLQSPDFNLKDFLSSIPNRESNDDSYISFDDVMNNNEIDTSSFSRKIIIPVGKIGPHIKNITFDVLGSGESFMIVAGTTGSGKSEFLHTLILDSAYLYSPKQLEFYLIDFKDGVEFSPYINKYSIPHIKLVSRKNTIDDALTILQRIQNIFIERNDLFEKEGCKDIISYNNTHPDNTLPRLFIIIDEYQVLLEGSGTNSRISSLCEEVLKDIVKRGRTAGLSLILSSQVNACGRDILSQINHRVVFKSNGVLTGLIDTLPLNAENELNGLPKGSAYHTSDGKTADIFRSAYIPNTSSNNETTKDKVVSMIREKYPSNEYPTNIIVSNDEKLIDYEEESIKYQDKIDLGISVFDNEHVTMTLSQDEFSNYLIVGDDKKNYDIEAAIINSQYVVSHGFEQYIYCSPSSYSYFKNNLKGIKIYNALDDLYSTVCELYNQMIDRRKQANKGINISTLTQSLLFINDFDSASFEQYVYEEEEEEPTSNEVNALGLPTNLSFLGRPTKTANKNHYNKSLIEMIRELYSQSYKYGIYLFIHSNNTKNLDGLFDYNTKGNFTHGFYLNKEAVNYYLEKTSFTSHKVSIENQNSVYVDGDKYVKFKRYNFEENK